MHGIPVVVGLLLCLAAAIAAADAEQPAVSAADLLAADVFPNACFGMAVEQASDGPTARVTTTGAQFLIHKAAGTIECRQRIGADRAVALLTLPSGALRDIRLAHQTPGAAIWAGGGTTVRVNGDSLLMVAPGRDGEITAALRFTPDYCAEYRGNHNFFDPRGGISFFEHGKQPNAKMTSDTPVRVMWPWKAADVFWAVVSPPKPYDWQASFRNRVILCGSSIDRFMYPSDGELWSFKDFANILYLHNEPMWEHWQLSLVPRDRQNYLRVMRTAREFGMKVMVYASPHFFTKGTADEHLAHPDPHIGIGQFTGANEPLYLEQVRRLLREFETSGLYFDEIYSSIPSLATQYHLTRTVREMLGAEGVLCYHATTDALGAGHTGTYCPTLHAYFDFVYKGEGEWNRREPAYTRYVLSTYSISNSIGVQVIDDRYVPSPQDMDFWLTKANLRFFLPARWFHTGDVDLFRRHYWPRLTPQLQGEIEPGLLQPVGAFRQPSPERTE